MWVRRYYFIWWVKVVSQLLERVRLVMQKIGERVDVAVVSSYWWAKDLVHHCSCCTICLILVPMFSICISGHISSADNLVSKMITTLESDLYFFCGLSFCLFTSAALETITAIQPLRSTSGGLIWGSSAPIVAGDCVLKAKECRMSVGFFVFVLRC